MRFLELLRGLSKKQPLQESFESLVYRRLEEFSREDYLGKAASLGDEAEAAMEQGDYDSAWRLLQEMKEVYGLHAARENFAPAQTLSLDAGVSLALANILRLEAKHADALVHILYWASTEHRTAKSSQQKLRAYFNRCRFKNVSMADAEALIAESRPLPDFVHIRDVVCHWRSLDFP